MVGTGSDCHPALLQPEGGARFIARNCLRKTARILPCDEQGDRFSIAGEELASFGFAIRGTEIYEEILFEYDHAWRRASRANLNPWSRHGAWPRWDL